MSLDARAYAITQALTLLPELYAWGGEDDDEGGYDCSGFVHEVLRRTARAWPSIYDGRRRSAASLHLYLAGRVPEVRTLPELVPGALVFYRRPDERIHHVAFHLYTSPPMTLRDGRRVDVGPVAIESGGSGSGAVTPRSALLASAGVRLTASDSQVQGAEWVSLDPFVVLAR